MPVCHRADLALALSPGIPRALYFKINRGEIDAETVLKEGPGLWRSLGFKANAIEYLAAPPWVLVDRCLDWQNQSARRAIRFLSDPDYPALLKEISAPPKVLFMEGEIRLLDKPQLAIVGTRSPSAAGRELALQFAYELARLAWVITSGLAIGIDGHAHQGALKGSGETIAVLGSGLDQIYPHQHKALAEAIAAQGLLLSEHPIGTKPLAQHFPARNRIISGLSMGVLVIEAALKSGSLITARYALEAGREVYAIPGSIHNPLAKGCHYLIQQGAKLVASIDDILEELSGFAALQSEQQKPTQTSNLKVENSLDDKALHVLNCIDFSPTSLDAIILRSGLTVPEVSAILFELELKGSVSVAGQGYERKP